MTGDSTSAAAGNAAELVAVALREDLRYGPDATTAATIAEDAVATGRFVARSAGVVAGTGVAREVLRQVVPAAEACGRAADGDRVRPGDTVLAVRGPVRGLLTAERTALNFLTHLSGIATLTARWVDAVASAGTRVRDTRKTLPGLRELQKYAVRCGGGVNHRLGLGDAVLIKDNHVAAAGSITAAVAAARERAPALPCEVEVDDIEGFEEALRAGATEILLDNFTVAQCAEAARLRGDRAVRLEASGGLSIGVARDYADAGVDYLAVGALTHSAPALDVALDLDR